MRAYTDLRLKFIRTTRLQDYPEWTTPPSVTNIGFITLMPAIE